MYYTYIFYTKVTAYIYSDAFLVYVYSCVPCLRAYLLSERHVSHVRKAKIDVWRLRMRRPNVWSFNLKYMLAENIICIEKSMHYRAFQLKASYIRYFVYVGTFTYTYLHGKKTKRNGINKTK